MKKAFTASVVALLLNSVFIFAQSKPEGSEKDFAAAFDASVRKTIETVHDIPGIAIVVIKGDKPIFLRAYGMADKEAGVKADVDTLFYIASSNKAFTALAAAMLDKERKILLADPVTKYTTGILFKTPVPDKITVRDLLTHTSGLRNEALIHRTAFSGQIDKAEIARVFADETTFDEANFGKYRYTNLGYNIYGLLLEYHLKLKWQDVLQQRIFDPAGLKHTTAYISRAPAKKWSVAAPYVFDSQAGRMVRSVLNKTDNNMQAAGGMFMSISDLGTWLNLNMNGGKLNGKQVMPADLIQAAHTGYTKSARNEPPFTGDGEYGLGWQIGKYRNEKVIYHHGGYPGYRSHVSFMPDKGLAVGVLVNNELAGGRAADVLAAYAYDWWLGTPDLEADYAKQLQEFADIYARRKQQSIADAAERAKRQSQLTQPLADYVGKYTNELLGTIEVTVDGNSLGVRMGNLYCQSTPYTEKDTIRVMMLPGGNGEVVGFLKGATGKFDLLKYAGRDFKRVGL
jgi:CubicO group peptidase (beta-lactamase class C family)